MKSRFFLSAMALLAVGTMGSESAFARHHDHDEYRGEARYNHDCRGGNGAVGTVAGGAGGALLGNAIIGGPVATIGAGVAGALVGRHLDKKHTRERHGC